MNFSYLFLEFNGRISRGPYWIGFCLLFPAALVAWLIASNLGGERLAAIVELAFLYPELAVIVKRANDREMPGWILMAYFLLSVCATALTVFGLAGPADEPGPLYWLVFLPLAVVGLFLLVDLGFRQGQHGPNRYGPDPLEGST
jgi:uncharacterized membrane protein YhaH (DUF805 family)